MVRSEALERRRKELKLSRRALGQLAGCGQQTIWRYGTGKISRPNLVIVRNIERALGLRKGDLAD